MVEDVRGNALSEIIEVIGESDLSFLENIKNNELIEHINRVGKVFYES